MSRSSKRISIPCVLVTIVALALPCPCPAEDVTAAVLVKAGRFREALAQLAKPPSTPGGNLEERTLLAQAYLGSGRYAEAQAVLTSASAGIEADPLAFEILARVAEAQGKLDRAIGLLSKAVEAKQKSLASTETVEGASALGDWLTRLGELQFRAGRLDPAKEQFQKAVSLVNRAHAKLHELGIPHDETDPRMFAAGATAGLAQVYAAKGDKTRAERTWRGVAARANDPAVLARFAAYSLAVKNDQRGARRTLDRALRLAERRPTDRRIRALILLDRGEAADQALALSLAEAAFKDGPDLYARDTLAWALHRRGEPDRAAEVLAPALAVGTEDPLVLYHAGAIAQAVGKSEEAKRLLTQALKINPGFDPLGARDARSILERLR